MEILAAAAAATTAVQLNHAVTTPAVVAAPATLAAQAPINSQAPCKTEALEVAMITIQEAPTILCGA